MALIFARFFQKGLSLVSTPIFTRIMTIEQYGSLSNFMSWQSILFIIATLNLAQGIFNNGMLEYKKDRDSFMLSLMMLSNVCTVIVFFVIFLFNSLFEEIINISFNLMILMFIYMLFYPAYLFWSARQRYELKYKMLTFCTIVISMVQMVISITFVLLAKVEDQAVVKVYATEIVMVIAGCVVYAFLFYKTCGKIKFSYIKEAFCFNVFLVPHYLAMTVLASGDKLMINNLIGSRETAIYSVSYTIASVVFIFWEAIEASWIPWLYEKLKEKKYLEIRFRSNQIVTLFAMIAVVCMLFAPELVKITASADYEDGMYVIPAVVGAVFFQAVYTLYMRLEYYSKKTKATMIGSVLIAFTNLGLNAIFIPRVGYLAAGYTTLACYVLLSVFHIVYVRRIGRSQIYDVSYIVRCGSVMVVISCVVMLLYFNIILRYLIIFAMFCFAFVKRKHIITILKK